MDTSEVRETLKYANDYLKRLVNLNVDLDYAVKQITLTAQETEESICSVFGHVQDILATALNKRKEQLISATKKIEANGVRPLVESRQLVLKTIESTTNFISLCCSLLNAETQENGVESQKDEFVSKSSQLGNLPEVPSLKEVPYISFQYELAREKELSQILDNFGSVEHIAPVQISSVDQRPGAILVEWNATDDDRACDIQEYRLQRAFGNINTDKELHKHFFTCYTGVDTQFLVKDMILDQDYTFRVCCKFEGDAQWSSWSLLQTGSTAIPPYCWNTNVENFFFSNDNRIVKPTIDCPVDIYSTSIKFNAGHSVEFTFLECDDVNLNETFVGLYTCESDNTRESVYVDAAGSIYGSGIKKLTQFPALTRGKKISFACEMEVENKLRINIDCSGKRVTYDWPINGNPIYFGAHFGSSKWKIMIE